MNYKNLLLFIICVPLFLFNSCEEAGSSSSKTNLPKARGALGEIILVIDSAMYAGPVGEMVKEVFQEDIKGIIREEPLFNIKKVDPRSLTRILKMATNMIYVTTFDDTGAGSRAINSQFTEASKKMALEDPSLYMLRSKDEFAVGQEVLYLFGNNKEELISNLRRNKAGIQSLFISRERERIGVALFSRKNSAATIMGREKMGIEINLPASYQFVQDDDDFMWFRQPTPRTSKPDISLFFYQTEYSDESQVFPENLIALRNDITKPRIFGDPDKPLSYIVTETIEPPVFTTTTVDGNYAMEMRGAWKTNNLSMGGSFLSYAVVDAENGKLYYMEGFVYYPNEAHRSSIREIETILLATEIPEIKQ
ncbi:DUF4837 family protein [Lunatibacter salilacus]|uniref:DUF4837 family protein n=1 Tax=Lunatibacter salilacus TaxID=2483804 RepID=UPI00131E9DD2|nr:DUF4837 family protein [Lunatibacter salilacus]